MNKNLEQRGVKSWYNGFKRISNFMNIDENIINETKSNEIKMIMKNLYKKTWEEERRKQLLNGKLLSYAEIKTKNCFEQYLGIENMNIRKAITKIRISAHKFPIETGRYEGKTRDDRICPLCCDGIGDEKHYIFECDNGVIKDIREECTKIIYKKSPQLKLLDINDKFKYILICGDESIMKDIGILFLRIQKKFENNI